MNSTTSSKDNPLNKIIGLSVVLSMGFLLVVLAGIYGNWFPIINGVIFAIAHLPVAITKAIADSNDYDFSFDPVSSSRGSVLKEFGQFTSAFLVVTGFYLPILLHHSHILTKVAMILTIIGGSLIYGTVFKFSLYFDESEDHEAEDFGGVI
ncbi:uncharacterized protein AC631_04750 [Debaryomyces fabryi]|uniref:Vacuolar protein sorting-associated protein 55 n=1 Tax=Debaryomyces fabryi TaxID=58627 RepID=A0A0V1PTY9_9ASCO|nr:uncharacterized protein AC631_04750 [Debaryomyces fabryi]KRZ99499.1 hypothetical protein AC631_04750 [Debaryomyces fabryi]CUM54111.1 unnamed protein product [Debaryomyces fabryi]